MLGVGAATVAALAAGCSRSKGSEQVTSASSDASRGPGAQVATTATSSSRPEPHTSPGRTAPVRNIPAVEYSHGSRRRNEVALTFHGGGDPAIARRLLTIFAAHKASVTVLAVGSWLAANGELAREIVRSGHALGNHTYHHLDIDSLDARTASAEIVQCRDLLISLIGSGGAHFRQSQAQHATRLVRKLAGDAGYRACLSYDVDSLDYTDPGAAAVRANVTMARPGSIVSMHFGHSGTVDAMPGILADLAARGLRPVTATTLLRR